MNIIVRWVLIGLATITFLVSLIVYDARFFVDSNTYYGNIAISTSWNHKLLVPFPELRYMYATINYFGLLYFVRKFHTAFIWPFFHPYHLMLLFNGTKEQLFFVGVVLVVVTYSLLSRAKKSRSNTGGLHFSMGLLGSIFFVTRGLYLPIIALAAASRFVDRLNVRSLVVVLAGAAVVFFSLAEKGWALLEWKARNVILTEHVGREYFPLLCQDERLNLLSLLPCWAMTNIGLPIHEPIFSFQSIVLGSFLVSYWWVTWLLLRNGSNSSRLMVAAMIVLSLVIFWWGPTLGAYHRYFAPVLWLGMLPILMQYRWRFTPRFVQYRVLCKSMV